MAGPRWLKDGEQRTWRAFLATTELLADALDRQLQADAGLTLAAYVVLAILSEAPGRALRMSELAWRTNSSQSRLSHVVARHEERGWVRREKCPTDKRGNIAVLTDAGFSALVSAAPGHVTAVRRLFFDRMTGAQVRQLRAICEAALAGLDPAGSLSAALSS